LLEESIVVAVISVLFLWHVRVGARGHYHVASCDHFVVHPDAMARVDFEHHVAWGIAIAIGAMVDAAIIMVENAHRGLQQFRQKSGCDARGRERFDIIVSAAQTVGRPLFFSLLVITVSFIPVFSLQGRRTTLSATGVHQDLLHVLCFTPWIGVGACPNDLVDPRQGHVGEKKSD